MEIQKIRLKRPPSSGLTPTYGSIPCSGGTNYWPINTSYDCSGITMYNSTYSMVDQALSGDMSTFPQELRDCSITNPCIILWDTIYIDPTITGLTECLSLDGHLYMLFMGLKSTSASTVTTGSYNEIIDIYQITNSDIRIPLHNQVAINLTANYGPPCNCINYLDEHTNQLTIFLDQDFNDIGHYSMWDGNVEQKDIFNNFVFSSMTSTGLDIRITNTTDFGYYKTLQDSPFIISWYGCDCNDPICFGGGGCQTLQFPNLTANFTYPATPPMQRKIILTQDTPWGKMKTTKVITTPALSFAALQVAYPPAPVQVLDPSGALMYTTSPGGLQDWGPLDSGIDINAYSANSPTPCFEFSGVSESILGTFQTYSSTVTSPDLAGGFVLGVWVPIGGDVIDPIDGSIQQGMQGQIFAATPTYTGYTVTSTGLNNTPIDFYDFTNGITIFVATSCGIDPSMFGGAQCAPCPDEDCAWCETKDEYVDRVTFTPTPIAFNINQGVWSQFVDYAVGDIVYDETYNTCCCFMAVHSIDQTSTTPDPWAGWPPATLLSSGIWQNQSGGSDVHIWEACSPDCVACPPGTQTPCNDVSLQFPTPILFPTSAGPQPMFGGTYIPGNDYYVGQFVEGPNGDCFQALVDMAAPAPPPTALTNSSSWDYIGCVSWICPPDLGNPGPLICEMISGQTPNSFTFYGGNQGCIYSYNGGECSADTAWYCLSGCSGCTEIDYTDPLYFTLGPIGNGVLFDSQTGCTVQCDPMAWSCTTPTGAQCCTEISCAMDWAAGTSQTDPGSYTNIMTNIYSLVPPSPLPNTPTWIANNFDLWTSPYFTGIDCESGCCDTTGYFWTCDQGCVLTPGQTMTLAECEYSASTGAYSYGFALTAPYTAVCGYNCIDPLIPIQYPVGNPPAPGTTPCEPCYNGFGCGNYSTLNACLSACTDCEMCWSCRTDEPGCPCVQLTCCPTISAGTNPLGLYGPNPALGTYPTETACTPYCDCTGGWDCWLEDDGSGTLVSIGYCASADTFFQNWQGWYPSPGGIYNTVEECCSGSSCCNVYCEDDPTINPGPNASNPLPPLGNYPCVYDPFNMGSFCYTYNPVIANPGLPYCTMQDCLLTHPSGTCEEAGCECACSGITSAVLNDMGTWDSMYTNYQQDDVVSWADPSDPLCCYICTCPFNFGFYDCNDPTNTGIPGGDPFAPNGTPNCWEKCLKTPGLPPLGCQTCLGNVTASTYECTVDGCENSLIVSGIPCIAPASLAAQTAQNCYTSSTCESECMASCYCGDLDNDPMTIDETGCVVQQDWLNNTNTNTIAPPYPTFPPVPAGIFNPLFPFASYNDCMSLFPSLDCCGISAMTYYCDTLQNCSTDPSNPGGCFPIPPGDPLYPGPFTSLQDCEDWCTWECDPSGWQQCIFNANTPPGPNTYISAYQCWQNTNDCFCNSGVTASTWFCDEAGVLAGNYTLPTDSPCVTDTFIAAQPFIYQTQAWGIGGPPFGNFSSGALGFPTQVACESSCRWCCDVCPAGTCFCDNLAWNQVTCSGTTGGQNLSPTSVNPFDCITDTTSFFGWYPCSAATVVVWYCDAVNGCSSYNQSSPPLTYASGPYFNAGDCEDACNFVCGPCEPGGFSTCVCNFVNQIIPLTCNTYSDMATCLASVPPLLFFADEETCCTCYECVMNVNVSFQVWNGSAWVIATQNITPMNVGAEPWVPSSIPSTNDQGYSPGDVVTFTYDNQTCCYVNVYSGTGVYWDIDPYYYYSVYLGNVAGNQPTFLGPPSGMPNPNTGSLVWVPCDDNCVVPSQGYWVCDTSNSPTCFCTYDPLATSGYATQGACENDVNTCCYVPPTGFWICEQQISPIPGAPNCICVYDPLATAGWTLQIDCETDTTNNNCCYIPPLYEWKCYEDINIPLDNDCANKVEFDITNKFNLVGFEDSYTWANGGISSTLYTNIGGGMDNVNQWPNFNYSCWPNNEVALQALVLTHGVNAIFSDYSYGVGSQQCSWPYSNTPGCCSSCSGAGNRHMKTIKHLNNLTIDAINGSTTLFSSWIDYINGAIAAGVPANLVTGLPPGTGVENGYLVGVVSLNHVIYQELNYGQFPCPGGIAYCDKTNAVICCNPPCICVQDINGTLPGVAYSTDVLCTADTSNCCGEEPDPDMRYDCIRDKVTKRCDCIPTKNGPYATMASCILAGQQVPPQNCCSGTTPDGYYVCLGPNPPAPAIKCTCVYSGTATAGYNSMIACQSDQLTCCYKQPTGFYICNSDCGCQWDPLAVAGYSTLVACESDPSNCCYTAQTDFYSCEKTVIIGPPGGNNTICTCDPNPLCTAPGPNCYSTHAACLTGNNCCGHQLHKSYDCDPIMGCWDNTPIGFFQGPNAFLNCTTALTNGTAPCDFESPKGCEDCDINLAGSLNVPMTYMGIWDPAQLYQVDQCISIPPTIFDTNCADRTVITSPPHPQSSFPMGAPSTIELLFSSPSTPAMQGAAFSNYKFEVGPVFGSVCKGPTGQGLAYVKYITVQNGPLVDPTSALYVPSLVGNQMVSWSVLLGALNFAGCYPAFWWVPFGWQVGVTAGNNGGYPHDYVTVHDHFLSVNTDTNGVSHDWTIHWEYCMCETLECCYCCIEKCNPPPGGCDAPLVWSYTRCQCEPPIRLPDSETLSKQPKQMTACSPGFFPPENLMVILPNGGHWETCNINVDNSPANCDEEPLHLCQDDCTSHLLQYMYYPSNGQAANLQFRPWSATYHYGIGDCVVDPNDGCCYCCVTSPTPGSPFDDGAFTNDPTSTMQPCSIYGGQYWGLGPDQNGDYHGWMSCTNTGVVPCTGIIAGKMWGCINGGTINSACVQMTGGQYTSQTDCYLYSNCKEPDTGFWRCQNGPTPSLAPSSSDFGGKSPKNVLNNPCHCVFYANATSGHLTYADCNNANNCCECKPPPNGCPPGWTWNQVKCKCEMPSIQDMVGDYGTPCVQTEDCERGWNWDWELCKCVSNNESGSGNVDTYK